MSSFSIQGHTEVAWALKVKFLQQSEVPYSCSILHYENLGKRQTSNFTTETFITSDFRNLCSCFYRTFIEFFIQFGVK